LGIPDVLNHQVGLGGCTMQATQSVCKRDLQHDVSIRFHVAFRPQQRRHSIQSPLEDSAQARPEH
jgi:hypothetical protein